MSMVRRVKSNNQDIIALNERMQKENNELKASLAVVQETLDKVMKEGGGHLLEQCKISYDELRIAAPIGEGSFGTVFLGKFVRAESVVTMPAFAMEMLCCSSASSSAP